MSDVKKNFIYNVLYQLLILIIPFITAPYLARVLGVNGTGTYSYVNSITSYFLLFSMLGLRNYGNRSVAKIKDDKNKLSKEFLSIYLMQFISCLIVLIIYIIFILIVDNYKIYFLIQSLTLISAFFDINWFFFGMEKFKLSTIINFIIRILSTISIFIFVKSSNDLYIYILIISISTLLSQLLLWPFLFKNIKLCKIKFKDIIKHIKPNLILFLPVISVSIYNLLDRVMLGVMTDTIQVGLYYSAERVVDIPTSIINALGTIMLPKITNLNYKKEDTKIKEYIYKSIKFMMFISIPISLGIFAVSEDFILFFYGEEFAFCANIVKILTFYIIIKSWACVIRTQYLIPMEKDNIFVKSICFGAIISLILNLILIPKYSAIGASIGTLVTEIVIMLYQTLNVRKYLPIKKYLLEFIRFFIKGMVMFIFVYLLNFFTISNILKFILQIIFGIIIYLSMNIKYLKEILNFKLVRK